MTSKDKVPWALSNGAERSSVEIEEGDLELSSEDKWLAQVLARTRFGRVGEVEDNFRNTGFQWRKRRECRGVRVFPCRPYRLPHLHPLKRRVAFIVLIFLRIDR